MTSTQKKQFESLLQRLPSFVRFPNDNDKSFGETTYYVNRYERDEHGIMRRETVMDGLTYNDSVIVMHAIRQALVEGGAA